MKRKEPRGLTQTRIRAFVLVLCLSVFCLPCRVSASTVSGLVRGEAVRSGLTVVGLPTRNLHQLPPASQQPLPTTPVDPQTGSFTLSIDDQAPTYLMVTRGCSDEDIQQRHFQQCTTWFPRRLPIQKDEELLIEIADQAPPSTHAVWRSGLGPQTVWTIGTTLIVLLLLIAGWLWRTAPGTDLLAEQARHEPTAPSSRGLALWFFLGSCLVLLIRLGAEPLGLLEYSYFHEGVRPDHMFDILHDSITAELAHGPLTPMLLRLLSSISRDAWWLRFPSVLFGALFVALVVTIVRSELNRKVAVLAGALALTSPLAVYYARDASPYALVGLCAAASVWLLCRAPLTRRPWLLWSGFVVLQVVGFFSHFGYGFVALSLFLAVCVVWYRSERRALSHALFAFAMAAIPVLMLLPHFLDVLQISGTRFALMSPIYSESPGAISYLSHFLTILSGFPAEWTLGLVFALPLWVLGMHVLWQHSRLLAWIVGLQCLMVVVFVLFNHAMYTAHGGGRIFYAFRYTRPLLLGVLIPIAASLLSPSRWMVWGLVAVTTCYSTALIQQPTRSSQRAAATLIQEHAKPGDAYAVLPANFYGDLFQYYLANESPPSLITKGNAQHLSLGEQSIWGPIMETNLPFETAVDHLDHARLWVVTYHESMFGIPKFESSVSTEALATVSTLCAPVKLPAKTIAGMDVHLYECDSKRVWKGENHLAIDTNNRFSLDRFVQRPVRAHELGDTDLWPLVIPGDATQLTVIADPSPSTTQESLSIESKHSLGAVSFANVANKHTQWQVSLTPHPGTTHLTIQPVGDSPPIIHRLEIQR
jgi:hypothetical protein